MGSKKDRHFLDALGEGLEAAWDLALDNEAVKAVPVVGTAFKLLKGYDDLRSRALASKLQKFLSEPSLQNALEARAFRQQILEDSKRAEEIGETLFLTLDNITDMSKPVLLARAYAAFLNGQTDSFTLEAIAHVLNIAFLRDIQAFLTSSDISNKTSWKQRLVSVGLLEIEEETFDGNIIYQHTPLGAAFFEVIENSDRFNATQ